MRFYIILFKSLNFKLLECLLYSFIDFQDKDKLVNKKIFFKYFTNHDIIKHENIQNYHNNL